MKNSENIRDALKRKEKWMPSCIDDLMFKCSSSEKLDEYKA
jgi:hypothetical protein